MKKIIAELMTLVLALSMVLGLNVASYADDETYTITIANSVSGTTYYVYIIFDATYDEKGNVSYTCKDDSYWYGKIANGDESCPFELGARNGDGYTVKLKDASDSETIVTWIQSNLDAAEYHGIWSGDGNGGSIEIAVELPGYYYVGTGSGAMVDLTTANPDATVYDKSVSSPGVDLAKATNGAGNSYSADKGESRRRIYTITTSAPTYVDGAKVDKYTLTDTLGGGLWTTEAYVGVLLLGANEGEYLGEFTDDAEIKVDDNVLTVSWCPGNDTVQSGIEYPSDARIMVIYQTTLTTGADELNLTNDVTLSWTLEDGSEKEPDEGWPEDSIWEGIYGFVLSKTDTSGTGLEGAEFTLSKTNENGDTEWILWDSTENEGDFIAWHSITDGTGDTYHLTSRAGGINVWGLAEGTYTLTETKAPDGYNALDDPVTIDISYADGTWTVTYWAETDGNPTDGETKGTKTGVVDLSYEDGHGVSLMPTVVIQNTAGTRLPETGGMGTYIFYVVGGLLTILGGALLITRSRLKKDDGEN